MQNAFRPEIAIPMKCSSAWRLLHVENMVTKIIQQGDRYLIPLDKETESMMGIHAGTTLDARSEGGPLIVSNTSASPRQAKLDQVSGEIESEYSPALRKLAE